MKSSQYQHSSVEVVQRGYPRSLVRVVQKYHILPRQKHRFYLFCQNITLQAHTYCAPTFGSHIFLSYLLKFHFIGLYLFVCRRAARINFYLICLNCTLQAYIFLCADVPLAYLFIFSAKISLYRPISFCAPTFRSHIFLSYLLKLHFIGLYLFVCRRAARISFYLFC